MDLKTVKNKLKLGKYKTFKDMFADVALIWDNCLSYNTEGSQIYNMAETMKTVTKMTISKHAEKLQLSVGGYTKKRDRKWDSKIVGNFDLYSETSSDEEWVPHDLRVKFAEELIKLPKDAMTKVVGQALYLCPDAISYNQNRIFIEVDALDTLSFYNLLSLLRNKVALGIDKTNGRKETNREKKTKSTSIMKRVYKMA